MRRLDSQPSDDLRHFADGDRSALARILTRIENGHSLQLPDTRSNRGSDAVTVDEEPVLVGITGSGGSGKSTLIGALVAMLRGQGKRIAVLACDPASPVTGGALLADRIRVLCDPDDEGLFFRSLSTRGAPGGIAKSVEPILPWLIAFGFDVILVETVGVGQDQVAVRALVNQLVLLVTPNTGDEIQWEKAGLIELADVIAVNKADLPGADQVKAQLASALSLSPNEVPPIVATVATKGDGIEALWKEIATREKEKATSRSFPADSA